MKQKIIIPELINTLKNAKKKPNHSKPEMKTLFSTNLHNKVRLKLLMENILTFVTNLKIFYALDKKHHMWLLSLQNLFFKYAAIVLQCMIYSPQIISKFNYCYS
ncbi:hypothetical protein B9G39_03515 [Zooshikella ganghwensis]|uniref:Uncharacterized protein n=1 Tax=Zooshikella ganghwensis TaxID=202772 RepID=A0A4P9VHE3_9GAMM|nr:hypothetical protein B9G39_03515 [Zooshikella ganghwensis]